MADDALTVLLALEAADRASTIVNAFGTVLADLKVKLLAVTGASEEEQAAAAESTNAFKGMSPVMMGAAVAGVGLALGMGALGVEAVKAGASFQQSQTALMTGAGENAKAMGVIQAGVLDMAGQVGVGAKKLSDDLYLVESAGYHGSAGLDVLRASEEAAKADMADASVVADALTTKLNAYHETSDRATSSANEMVTAVALGKMHMQDFAGSLSASLPVAAALHVSFAEVAGAIATMTAQGMSSQQANQDYANTLRALSSPNNVAIAEMQAMGLSSVDVAQHLGDRGLTGTLKLLSDAITAHMGPDGLVVQKTFLDSKAAAADANQEIAAMPANLQKLATAFLNGQVTAKDWRKDLQALSPEQQHLMQQFAGTADKAHQFNALLSAGNPAAQTFAGAMEKMLGGATGLNTALMLGGEHMGDFKSNVDSIADAGKKGGKDIADWGVIQGNFNQQMDQAKAAVGAAGIALGLGLLPPLTSLAKAVVPVVTAIAQWISHNQTLAAAIVIGLGALGALVAILSVIVVIGPVVGAAFTLMLGPVGLIILAVVALIAVAVLVITHWSQIAVFFSGVLHAALQKGGQAFSALGSAVHTAVASVLDWLKEHWMLILAIIGGPFVAVGLLVATHWSQIKATVVAGVHAVTGVVQGFVNGVVHFFEWLYQHNYYFKFLVDSIRLTFEKARDDAVAIWTTITIWITEKWILLRDTAEMYWTAVTRAISDKLNDAWSAITGVWNRIANWLHEQWIVIRDTGEMVWTAISTVIGDKLNDAWGHVTGFVSQITDKLGGLAGQAYQWASNMIGQFAQGILDKVGQVSNAASGVASAVAGVLGFHSPPPEGPASDSDRWMPNFIAMLVDGLEAGTPRLTAASARLAGNLAGPAGSNGSSLGLTMYGTQSGSVLGAQPAGASGSDEATELLMQQNQLLQQILDALLRPAAQSAYGRTVRAGV